MKTCSKCEVERPEEGFYLHASGARRRVCEVCRSAARKLWKKANPEKVAQHGATYRTAHAEEMLARYRENHAAHREARNTQSKEYAQANAAQIAKRKRAQRQANRIAVAAAARAWQQTNPDKVAASSARRRAAEVQATPAWADPVTIGEFYWLAAWKTKETGMVWHVDHIVPLRSKVVCGLHTDYNLQVIPASENTAKSNRYWPDMPEVRAE